MSPCVRSSFRAGLVGLLAFGAVPLATAQSFYGGVRGAARDADGVASGVQLTLINEETAIARTSTTNAAGEYAFIDVIPGSYTLRAVLTGYRTVERPGLPPAPMGAGALTPALPVAVLVPRPALDAALHGPHDVNVPPVVDRGSLAHILVPMLTPSAHVHEARAPGEHAPTLAPVEGCAGNVLGPLRASPPSGAQLKATGNMS